MDKLRKKIDELDVQILDLLNERAKCVLEIGRIKQQQQTSVVVPQREQELLSRMVALNQGPMTEEMVRHLYQNIMDTLKVLQK